MRAVQLVRWQAEPELRETETPEPAPGEVLVKILGAGLCHSDLHVMEFPEGTMPWKLPFTLGHENAGIVDLWALGLRELSAVRARGREPLPSCCRARRARGRAWFRRRPG